MTIRVGDWVRHKEYDCEPGKVVNLPHGPDGTYVGLSDGQEWPLENCIRVIVKDAPPRKPKPSRKELEAWAIHVRAEVTTTIDGDGFYVCCGVRSYATRNTIYLALLAAWRERNGQ